MSEKLRLTQHIRCGLSSCPSGHPDFVGTSYMLGTLSDIRLVVEHIIYYRPYYQEVLRK
ncbi:MAG: hypothetical protein ACXQTW_01630 [Candidatus Methanospirareceae archaeon]